MGWGLGVGWRVPVRVLVVVGEAVRGMRLIYRRRRGLVSQVGRSIDMYWNLEGNFLREGEERGMRCFKRSGEVVIVTIYD